MSTAPTYAAAVKTARMQAVADQIDAGTGPGTLELCTAGFAAVVRTFTLNDPCGTVSGSVLTLAGFPKTESASVAGDLAVARIKDSDGNVKVNNLSIGTSGTAIIVDNVSVAEDQNVTIVSGTITHAADPT